MWKRTRHMSSTSGDEKAQKVPANGTLTRICAATNAQHNAQVVRGTW
jgi:hypothetical protein